MSDKNNNSEYNGQKSHDEEVEKTLFYDLKSINDENRVSEKTQKNKKQNLKRLEKKAEKLQDKKESKENRRFFRIVWIIMIVLVGAMLTKYILVGIHDMLAINKEENVVTVTFPTNANLRQTTKILSDNGIIEDPSFFKLYAVLTKANKSFSGGTFDIKTNMDYEALINYLQSQTNRTDIIKLTFSEGRNVNEYADILESNGVCSKDEFLKICSSDEFDEEYSFIKSIPNADKRYYKLEGYLFPDTYQFYKDENPYNVVDKILSNFEQKIKSKEKVEDYDKKVSLESRIQEKSVSIDNILTIASLIEGEAADEYDMYIISSIIYNRLSTLDNGGINEYNEYGLNKLGLDTTIWYPYRDRNSVPSDIVSSFKSTYNTYDIEGLPPGPICNPGSAAIEAALNPASTDYYYFCYSESREVYYAKTLAQHNRNLVLAGLV